MSTYHTLIVSEEENILLVTINRPKSLNALNDDVFVDLIQLFVTDIKDKDYRGVVLTGAGEKAFVAGADIKEFLSLDTLQARSLSQRGHDIFKVIENYDIPVIAAVNGFALGGGCELAMACHLRVAGTTARFGQPEVNLGIIPGYGGTQRLVQLIGKSRALELILTGDMIDAKTAMEYGLINALCEPGKEVGTAKDLIRKISKKAPLAIAQGIKVVNAFFEDGVNGFDAEVESFANLSGSEDFKEGATAFIEKRKPEWKRR